MKCPDKMCGKEIPDDSIFCDQCGVHLKQCTKCGNITLANFCNECGGMTMERKLPENQNTVQEQVQTQEPAPQPQVQTSTQVQSQAPVQAAQPVEPQEAPAGGTVIIDVKPDLKLVHASFTITPASGDILGRTTGPHANQLGQFPVISSKHAKVELLGDEWYFTDLHSSNKSYLNDRAITPDSPVKLSDGDKLVLANVPFTVSIK